MNRHEKAALDDLLQWRNETRRLDDVIASQRERIKKLEEAAATVLCYDWPGISEEAAAALDLLEKALAGAYEKEALTEFSGSRVKLVRCRIRETS